MSHELRTPLNSSLILAKLLADNPARQPQRRAGEFAQTIQSSGNDLLTLINDILDLSKIEAGHMEIRPESCSLARVSRKTSAAFSRRRRARRTSSSGWSWRPTARRSSRLIASGSSRSQEPAVECIQVHREGRGGAESPAPATARSRCRGRDTGIGISEEHNRSGIRGLSARRMARSAANTAAPALAYRSRGNWSRLLGGTHLRSEAWKARAARSPSLLPETFYRRERSAASRRRPSRLLPRDGSIRRSRPRRLAADSRHRRSRTIASG